MAGLDATFKAGRFWYGIESIDGNGDLVFCGTKYGLLIYDISNPANPIALSHMYLAPVAETFGSFYFYDLQAVGTYLVARASRNLLIDVSDPVSPREIEAPAWVGSHVDLEVHESLVYVVNSGGLEIYDAADLSLRLSRVEIGGAIELAVSYPNVAVSTGSSFTFVDVTSPTAPLIVDFFAAGVVNSQTTFDLDGDVLFLTRNYNTQYASHILLYRIGNWDAPLHECFVDGGIFQYTVHDGMLYRWNEIDLDIRGPMEEHFCDTVATYPGFPVHRCRVRGSRAYLAGRDGGPGSPSVVVLDVADPISPTILAHCGMSGWGWSFAATDEDIFAISAPDSIWRIDWRDPEAISVPARHQVGGSVQSVAEEGGRVYVGHQQGFEELNAASLSFREDHDLGYTVSDIEVVGDGVFLGSGAVFNILNMNWTPPPLDLSCDCSVRITDVAVQNDIAVVLLDEGRVSGVHAVRSIRITEPYQCLLGEVGLAGDLTGVVIQGGYAFVAEGGVGVRVFDISQPADLHIVGTYFMANGRSLQLDVDGQYLVVSEVYDSRVHVVDISDPTNPTLAAAFVVPYGTTAVALRGNKVCVGGNAGVAIFELSLVVTSETDPLEVIDRIDRPVQVHVSGGSGAARGTLYYRHGGESLFAAQLPMVWDNASSVLRAVVPQALLGSRGLEYYIEVERGEYGASIGSPARPYRFVVELDEVTGTRPDALPRAEYRIIGLPLDTSAMADRSVRAVFVNEFGEYDRTVWRIGSYDPSIGSVREGYEAAPVVPGQGYWLIVNDGGEYGSAGRTMTPNWTDVSGNEYYRVPLLYDTVRDDGWNLLANPFPFAVAWDDVRYMVDGAMVVDAGSDVVDALVHYYDGQGFQSPVVTVPAWEGVAVHANREGVEALFRYREDAGLSAKSHEDDYCCSKSGQTTEGEAWRLTLELAAAGFLDRCNRAGVATGATEGFDAQDHLEPPAPPGAPSICFSASASPGRRLCEDMRNAGNDLNHWSVHLDGHDQGRVLTVRGVNTLPEGHSAWLCSARGDTIRLSEGLRFAVPDRLYQLDLYEGRDGALRDHHQLELPHQVALMPAFPNPFNAATSIRFDLPSPSRVRLAVFDVRGARVAELVNGELPAGSRRLEWNGRDARGRSAASGVYFCRLEASGQILVERLVLVR